MGGKKPLELAGQKFGRLHVIERRGSKRNKSLWFCVCDCGNELEVVGSDLKNGNSNSCGCYKNDRIRDLRYSHGKSKTRIHNIWWAIYQRCCDENSSSYHLYGAKGVTLCDEWKSFDNFNKWSFENGYKENLSIDRIDNNLGYAPNNCRWTDMKTQQRNRSNNRYITIGGVTKRLCEWSEETGLHHVTILSRINRGIPEDKWLSTDPLPRRDSKKLSGVKRVYWHSAAEKWVAVNT